jgi:hypothetical protein
LPLDASEKHSGMTRTQFVVMVWERHDPGVTF